MKKNSSDYLTFKGEEERGISRAIDTLRPCYSELKTNTPKGLTNIHVLSFNNSI